MERKRSRNFELKKIILISFSQNNQYFNVLHLFLGAFISPTYIVVYQKFKMLYYVCGSRFFWSIKQYITIRAFFLFMCVNFQSLCQCDCSPIVFGYWIMKIMICFSEFLPIKLRTREFSFIKWQCVIRWYDSSAFFRSRFY